MFLFYSWYTQDRILNSEITMQIKLQFNYECKRIANGQLRLFSIPYNFIVLYVE